MYASAVKIRRNVSKGEVPSCGSAQKAVLIRQIRPLCRLCVWIMTCQMQASARKPRLIAVSLCCRKTCVNIPVKVVVEWYTDAVIGLARK